MALIDFSLSDAGEIIKDIREAWTGEAIADPQRREEYELKLRELQNRLLEGQMAINKVEASSESLFVSGARPAILWIGGFSLAYNFILAPFIHSLLHANGIDFPLPVVDASELMALITAMLGIGGYRTYEKARGIHNHNAR